MPEWGMMQVPKKLLERGIRDILRISDARMSGTHFGTVILHVSPEAAIGGPLSLVETGDIIHLNAKKRLLKLDVTEDILEERKRRWIPPVEKYERGWVKLYKDHVNQADIGADLDFLEHGPYTPEPEIN